MFPSSSRPRPNTRSFRSRLARSSGGARLLRVECFKSRFGEEFTFTLTLRPDLSASGDFVVTSSPQADAEQANIDRLADTIRSHPGQPKERIIAASGVAQRRGRVLLERFDGDLWRTETGPRHAILYFPVEREPGADPGT